MELPPVFEEVCRRNQWLWCGDHCEIKLEDGRRQKVYVEPFEYGTEKMVRIVTVVGSIDRIRGERLLSALRINYGLPHGALAIRGDDLVLIDTFLLRDADPGEVESAIRFIAETADYYEKSIYGTDEH